MHPVLSTVKKEQDFSIPHEIKLALLYSVLLERPGSPLFFSFFFFLFLGRGIMVFFGGGGKASLCAQ